MEKEIWDCLAEEYQNTSAAVTDWKLGYSVIESLLQGIGQKKIVDYGCGSGKFSRRLRDLGALVTAVDLSASAISLAKKRNSEGIAYHVIGDKGISFIAGQSIDHAVAAFVLCTIQEESIIMNIAVQIYEKLVPGGYFIVLEPHPDSLGYDFISMKRERPAILKPGALINVELAGMKSSFYDYWRPKEYYLHMLNKAGFEIDELREHLAKPCEEISWKDELVQPPFLIIRAKKPLVK